MLIRRSNLLVHVSRRRRVENAWRHDADAVTLDLEARAASAARRCADPGEGRDRAAARGGAEVFVRVNESALTADLEAAVWPGLTRHRAAARRIGRRRRRRGRNRSRRSSASAASKSARSNSSSLLESARRRVEHPLDPHGEPAHLAGRVSTSATSRASLGINPDPELDPFDYARGRLAVEATAAKVGAVGMAYPLSVDAARRGLGSRSARAGDQGAQLRNERRPLPASGAGSRR